MTAGVLPARSHRTQGPSTNISYRKDVETAQAASLGAHSFQALKKWKPEAGVCYVVLSYSISPNAVDDTAMRHWIQCPQ